MQAAALAIFAHVGNPRAERFACVRERLLDAAPHLRRFFRRRAELQDVVDQRVQRDHTRAQRELRGRRQARRVDDRHEVVIDEPAGIARLAGGAPTDSNEAIGEWRAGIITRSVPFGSGIPSLFFSSFFMISTRMSRSFATSSAGTSAAVTATT